MLGAGEELHVAHHGDVVPRSELVPQVAAQPEAGVASSPQVGSLREESILGVACFVLVSHQVEIILTIFTFFNHLIYFILFKITSEFSSKTFFSKASSADGMLGKE